VFKLGIGNDLGIFYPNFEVERSKVKITGLRNAKSIECDRMAGVSYALYRVPAYPLVLHHLYVVSTLTMCSMQEQSPGIYRLKS